VWLAGHVSLSETLRGRCFYAGLRFMLSGKRLQENTTVGHAAGAKHTLP
jgi:hypothetical protein